MRYPGGILTDLLLVMNTGYRLGSWARISPSSSPHFLLCSPGGEPPRKLSEGRISRAREPPPPPPARVTVAEEMHSRPSHGVETTADGRGRHTGQGQKELSTDILMY